MEQASILSEALAEVAGKEVNFPCDVEGFLSDERRANLERFDTEFYQCKRNIETCLQKYLDSHENEFIEWVL